MARANTIRRIPIRDLLLDKKNPRFGGNPSASDDQKSLLDSVVEYGINDLLASMSTNGYFHAEPVVVIEQDGEITVVEGNRRLAAALILTGDERAAQYRDIKKRWTPESDREKIESLREFPVSVFEERNKELIAYLGAKHIKGSKPWDSYAKAHWLFELMSASGLEPTIGHAAQLIGDHNPNTVKRILEAYVLMRQLRDERRYRSDSSQVRGRGSNPDYPFSWVYTSIGYENIREWIDISGLDSQDKIHADTQVLKSNKALENGERLVLFLFGSTSKPARPAVDESRQIRLLNDVVRHKASVMELEHGNSLKEVWEKLRPAGDRLADLFYETQVNLEKINTLVATETLQQDDLNQFITMGQKSQNILNTVVATLERKLEILL